MKLRFAARWTALSLVALLTVTSGCATDTLEAACSSELDHRKRCDPVFTEGERAVAYRQCAAQPKTYRADYYATITDCYARFGSCPLFNGELIRCLDTSARALPVTPLATATATALCNACPNDLLLRPTPLTCVQALTTPSRAWQDPLEPLPVWLLNATTQQRLLDCASAAGAGCAEVRQCFRDILR